MARPRRARIETITERASVTPLELFFDGVFVFALTRVTDWMADEPIIPGQRALSPFTRRSATEIDPRIQAYRGHFRNAPLAERPTWYHVTLAGTDRWVDLILRFRFDRVNKEQ